MHINVIQHINRIKGKNYKIISIHSGKSFEKIQYPFMIKALKKLGIEQLYCNVIEVIYEKPISNIILNREKLKSSSLNSVIKQGCPLFSYII
jgi:hypothetical protein